MDDIEPWRARIRLLNHEAYVTNMPEEIYQAKRREIFAEYDPQTTIEEILQ